MIGLIVFIVISIIGGIHFTRDDFGASYIPTAGEAFCRFCINFFKTFGVLILIGIANLLLVWVMGTMFGCHN